MAYWDIAQMSADPDLTARCAAAAAQESIPDPRDWAAEHMLDLAASPGWSEAWASAVAGENPNPGRDPAVVTDGMILSATQAVNSAP
jgi:hypothetical protein